MTTKPNLDTLEGRLRALLDGYYLQSKTADTVCSLGANTFLATFPSGVTHKSLDTLFEHSDWQYYTEPKQKPTMAECLKAEKVRLTCSHPDTPSEMTAYKSGAWNIHTILYFREAITDPDGLGWEIEIVETEEQPNK